MRKDLEKYKKERLGEENYNNQNILMKIIEYNNKNDIIIEFQDEYRAKIHTQYNNFKKGNVKNPYYPCIFNIGYYGQGKYKCKINNKDTKAYKIWRDMLKRCYDPYYLNKEPTYIDCYVCDEWHCFQNFAEWFYKNYYEIDGTKMALDKDILVKNNKIYSPKTCIFVPNRINNLFIKSNKSRGRYPIGVYEYYDKEYGYRYLIAQCNTLEKKEYLGTFPINRPFQAFYTYKQYKENYIKKVADEYKELISNELYNTLYKYEVEIND